jgi:hypothetical protein
MKKQKLFLVLSFLSLICFAQANDEKKDIVGTWISEEDSNWKIVFTADSKYIDYYEGRVSEKGIYSLSNTIPQSEPSVPTGNGISYLKLVDSDKVVQFYEINGISSTTLSLTWIDNGNLLVFKRQQGASHSGSKQVTHLKPKQQNKK